MITVLLDALVALEHLLGRGLLALVRLARHLAARFAVGASALVARIAALPAHGRRRAGIAAAALALGVGAWDLRDGPLNAYEAAAGKRPLLRAKSWQYQLGPIRDDIIRLNPADLIVMDHATNGGREALTADAVARIKTRADGSQRTAVVSYISVGEAEDYRWYWQPAWSDPAKKAARPPWLGDANCAWPDNYAVEFWHAGWKHLIYGGPDSFIARIVKAGFDGVYLDRVDIYEQYKDTRPSAEADMVQFVTELAAAARALKPGFLIIAQNGEDLLLHKRYRRAIDGLGKEDLLHGSGGTGVRNTDTDIAWSYDRIRKLRADHKPVFAVEYLVTREAIADARGELRERGLVPTFAHRSLDGSDPTMPRFEKEAAIGTPEYVKQMCVGQKSW